MIFFKTKIVGDGWASKWAVVGIIFLSLPAFAESLVGQIKNGVLMDDAFESIRFTQNSMRVKYKKPFAFIDDCDVQLPEKLRKYTVDVVCTEEVDEVTILFDTCEDDCYVNPKDIKEAFTLTVKGKV